MSDHPETPAFQSVNPILPVEDLDAALAYYRDGLDFEVRWQWGDPPERAGVGRDALELQLLANPDIRPAAPAQVYFHMTGIEAYFEACAARGVAFDRELEERPWGVKDFLVVDPGGNRVGFAEAAS